jgi:hypothetical protein
MVVVVVVQLMEELGYEYVMRLSELSAIRSPIPYHLPSRLHNEGVLLGYRQVTQPRATVLQTGTEAPSASH